MDKVRLKRWERITLLSVSVFTALSPIAFAFYLSNNREITIPFVASFITYIGNFCGFIMISISGLMMRLFGWGRPPHEYLPTFQMIIISIIGLIIVSGFIFLVFFAISEIRRGIFREKHAYIDIILPALVFLFIVVLFLIVLFNNQYYQLACGMGSCG